MTAPFWRKNEALGKREGFLCRVKHLGMILYYE